MDNCWWIILIIVGLVAALSVVLILINRKEKKVKKDFQEKVLIVDNSVSIVNNVAEEKPAKAVTQPVGKSTKQNVA